MGAILEYAHFTEFTLLIAETLSQPGLEPDFVGWYICLSAWWRIESQKRLFGQSCDQNQLFTPEINSKLEKRKNHQLKNNQLDNLAIDVLVQSAHWSCITGFELLENLEKFSKFLSTLDPEIGFRSVFKLILPSRRS